MPYLATPGLHDALTRRREAGPVVETRFMNMPAYAITRYEPLLTAFRDGERFPPERIYQLMFEPICGRTFQTMTGRDHLIRRRLATPASRYDPYRPYMIENIPAWPPGVNKDSPPRNQTPSPSTRGRSLAKNHQPHQPSFPSP